MVLVISDLNVKEIVGTFYEKNCKRQAKKNLEYKMSFKGKMIN